MLNDDERVSRLEQLAQCAHEFGNVVKVQPGGRLVKQKQGAFAGQTLATLGRTSRRLGQKPGQLEALRFAARQGGHRLPQTHIFQPHIDNGLQRTNDIAVLRKQGCGFADREGQHIGHIQVAWGLPQGLALDLDFENFRPVALAIAIRATQIHIAQKLHFDMLKARAATTGATPVTAVGTEFAGGVTALARQGRRGKNFSNRIPRAHITHGVGSGRFANGRLVYKHHIAQVVGAQHAVVRAGGFGGFAKVAHQGRRQHVLDQAGLARATHTGDGDQALQRKVDADVLQIVLTRTLQNEPRGAVADHAFEAQADLLASAQVGPREGVGLSQVIGGAVEHNLSATLAGARPHVDHAVSGQHHGRVVLDHHQGVAGIAQAVHGLGDAVHVAGVQANAGLVQHEQGVDQTGAQCSGQVDALHLTATQGAALTVEREVANAHIAQVLQAGGDFFQQQLQGFLFGAGAVCGQSVKELPQPVQRHDHHVVQAQARQGFQLGPCPLHAGRHETLVEWQNSGGLSVAANAPQQALGFETCAMARGAFGVTAVLGQQHTNVHFVGLALQVLKEALDPVPLLVPLAFVIRRALDDPVFLCSGQLLPRRVAGNACGLGMAHQIVLALFPCRSLNGLDGTGTQGEFFVRNDQAVVDANDPAKTTAGVARPHRRVERKHGGNGIAVAHIAVRAMQPGRKTPLLKFGRCGLGGRRFFGIHIQATAAFQGHLDGFDDAGFFGIAQPKAVRDHIQHFARAGGCGHLPLGLHLGEAAGRQPLRHLLGAGVGGQLNREGQVQARVLRLRRTRCQLGINGFGGVMPHGLAGFFVKQLPQAGKQEFEVVVQLGHGAHRGAGAAHRVGLINGNGGRNALDLVHGRFVHAV